MMKQQQSHGQQQPVTQNDYENEIKAIAKFKTVSAILTKIISINFNLSNDHYQSN